MYVVLFSVLFTSNVLVLLSSIFGSFWPPDASLHLPGFAVSAVLVVLLWLSCLFAIFLTLGNGLLCLSRSRVCGLSTILCCSLTLLFRTPVGLLSSASLCVFVVSYVCGHCSIFGFLVN